MKRRLPSFLLLVPIVACFGLADLHGRWIGHYDFWRSPRLVVWTSAFALILLIGSYASGLPDYVAGRVSAFIASSASAIGAAVGISLAQLAVGTPLLPRFVVLFTVAFAAAWGIFASVLAADVAGRSATATKAVVVGRGDEVTQLASELQRSSEQQATIVGAIDPQDAVATLATTVNELKAQIVILDRHAQEDEEIVAISAQLHQEGVRIRTLSLFYEEWLGKLPLSELRHVSLMFDIGEVHRLNYARQKRILDVIIGVVLLMFTVLVAAPIFLLNTSFNRGPLLFRQERVGRQGRNFTIYKFRSMPVGDIQSDWTTASDPRLRPFGRLLRRTHLDEFPQSWNLLRGDLSLIGPRPEQPGYVDDLRAAIPFYEFRHIVRPGLTGWAQVKFSYGASVADAKEKLQYDFYYLRRQGFSLDISILIRTLRSILTGQGR